MSNQCRGKGEEKSKLTLRFLTINGTVVSFKEIGNNGERTHKGDKVIKSIQFYLII